jgi:hypothetical protein
MQNLPQAIVLLRVHFIARRETGEENYFWSNLTLLLMGILTLRI